MATPSLEEQKRHCCRKSIAATPGAEAFCLLHLPDPSKDVSGFVEEVCQ